MQGGMQNNHSQSGSALLISVMALLLLGLSLVGALRYLGPKVSLARQQTVARQTTEVIRQSLYVFVARNYRLPCPANGALTPNASGYGEEQLSGTSCAITDNSGVVPWKTLGIQYSDALDPWGDYVGYAVSRSLTSPTTQPYNTSSQPDALTVKVNGAPSAGNFAYVLISYGQDRRGAYLPSGQQYTVAPSTYEAPNTQAGAFDATQSFVWWPYSSGANDSSQQFDDSLIYEPSSQVCKGAFGAAGCGSNSVIDQDKCNDASCFTSKGPVSLLDPVTNGTPVPGHDTVMIFGTPTTSNNPNLTYVGAALPPNTSACQWANKVLPFTSQTLRAYFEFDLPYAPSGGDGFTFTLIPGATKVDTNTCGGSVYVGGTVQEQGSWLGFENILAPTNATAQAVMTGSVGAIAVTNGGSGYTAAPTVTLSGGGGSGASASAVLGNCTNGKKYTCAVNSIDVLSGGTGYTSTPQVSISGGGGSGASAVATLSQSVSSITVTDGGSGFTSPETTMVAVLGGFTPASATATIDKQGRVSGISVTNGGSGYVSAPTVTITAAAGDLTGTHATATATVANGQVTSVTIGDDGANYSVPPTISFSGGFNAAQATANITSGSVTGVTVNNGGSGYTSSPNISFYNVVVPKAAVEFRTYYYQDDPPNNLYSIRHDPSTESMSVLSVDTVSRDRTYHTSKSDNSSIPYTVSSTCDSTTNGGSAGGTGATATATINGAGGISSIDVPAGPAGYPISGSGYTSPPAVSISGGGGAGSAFAYSTLGVASIQVTNGGSGYVTSPLVAVDVSDDGDRALAYATTANGSVTGITVFYPGAGYTAPPTVHIAGTGRGAQATASMGVASVVIPSGGSGSGYTSTPTVSIASGGGCTYTSAATNNILTDDYTSPAAPPMIGYDAYLLNNYNANNGHTIYYHPVRIEMQRYCNSDCSQCGASGSPGNTNFLVRAFLDCDGKALGETDGQNTYCSDLSKNYLIGSNFPLPDTATGYSTRNNPLPSTFGGAHTLNYCMADPAANSPLGMSAFDKTMIGLTVGAGSAQTGLMVRHFRAAVQ